MDGGARGGAGATATPSRTDGGRQANQGARARDSARKDKALAETTALLVLKKKLALLWGEEDDDTDEQSGK